MTVIFFDFNGGYLLVFSMAKSIVSMFVDHLSEDVMLIFCCTIILHFWQLWIIIFLYMMSRSDCLFFFQSQFLWIIWHHSFQSLLSNMQVFRFRLSCSVSAHFSRLERSFMLQIETFMLVKFITQNSILNEDCEFDSIFHVTLESDMLGNITCFFNCMICLVIESTEVASMLFISTLIWELALLKSHISWELLSLIEMTISIRTFSLSEIDIFMKILAESGNFVSCVFGIAAFGIAELGDDFLVWAAITAFIAWIITVRAKTHQGLRTVITLSGSWSESRHSVTNVLSIAFSSLMLNDLTSVKPASIASDLQSSLNRSNSSLIIFHSFCK